MDNSVDIKTSNIQELDNLTFSLSQRVSPALVWLTTDSQETMYEVYFKLKQRLASYTFTDVRIDDIHTKFTDDEVSLVNMLQQTIPKTLNKSTQLSQVINIFGIEKFINKHQDDAPIIRQLNFERELLYRKFNCILIIWSDEYSTQLVSKHANDFWDWMTYEFSFSNDYVHKKGIDTLKTLLISTQSNIEYRDIIYENLVAANKDIKVIWNYGLATDTSTYQSKIEQSDIIILLVNSELLSATPLIESINGLLSKQNTTVIPIIVEPCDWKNTRLSILQALPLNGEPIQSNYWKNDMQALKGVVRNVNKTINNLTKNNPPPENCLFIWSANQDFEYAEKIFEYLNAKELYPWLPQYEKISAYKQLSLLKQTIDKAAYCIVIVSENTDKEQGDMKAVLEYAIEKDNKQPDKIFTIPIKIDNINPKNFPGLPQTTSIPMYLNPTDEAEKDIFGHSMEALISRMTDEAGFKDFETLKKDELKRLTLGAHETYEDSLTRYSSKQRLRPVDYVRAGLYSFADEDYTEAIKRFNYALNAGYPESPEILNKIGASLIMLNEWNEAEFVLRSSIELRQTYPLSWYNLGILLKEQKKYKEAIENFENAINKMEATDTKYVVARNNLATTYVTLYKQNKNEIKRLSKAIKILKEIKEKDMDNEHLKSLTFYNLACMYALQGYSDKALIHIRQSLEADPRKVFNAEKENDFIILTKNENTKQNFQKILKMTAIKYKQILQDKIIRHVQGDENDEVNKLTKIISKLNIIINT